MTQKKKLTTALKQKKVAGKVHRDKCGNLSATTVLASVDTPDAAGRTYSSDALQKLARSRIGYLYDEKREVLLKKVSTCIPRTEEMLQVKVEDVVDPHKLPHELRECLIFDQEYLADDTNVAHLGEMVSYTKVWAFLSSLVQDSKLNAFDLFNALRHARCANGDEIFTVQDGANAHKLMQMYFGAEDDV